MSDLIRREDAIKAFCNDCRGYTEPCEHQAKCRTMKVLRNKKKLPSADRAQDDEFKNFDRESLILLIEAQKERIGELLADRPQGEWVCEEVKVLDEETDDGFVYEIRKKWKCSNCNTNKGFIKPNDNFCSECGADMRGKGADDEV